MESCVSCHFPLCSAEKLPIQISRSSPYHWLDGEHIIIESQCACRYMRIYNVAIKDRALVYAWFFLMFTIHIAFCIWSAISPPLPFTNDWSHAGFVTCIKAFDKNTFVGVVYVIGGVFWSLESLWSLWALKTVSCFSFVPICLPASLITKYWLSSRKTGMETIKY